MRYVKPQIASSAPAKQVIAGSSDKSHATVIDAVTMRGDTATQAAYEAKGLDEFLNLLGPTSRLQPSPRVPRGRSGARCRQRACRHRQGRGTPRIHRQDAWFRAERSRQGRFRCVLQHRAGNRGVGRDIAVFSQRFEGEKPAASGYDSVFAVLVLARDKGLQEPMRREFGDGLVRIGLADIAVPGR